jgi:hypothetical protein
VEEETPENTGQNKGAFALAAATIDQHRCIRLNACFNMIAEQKLIELYRSPHNIM